jgi:Tfp pilus assembly protein PilF
VKHGVRLDEASVYDIAPTVLALFHQPVPRSWPGRVLGRALAPELFAANPVRLRADDPVRRGGGEPAPADQQESNELREKLQSLGYVSAASPPSMTTNNNQGLTLLGDRKYVEAAAFFRQALAAAPTQPTLMVNLGIALRFSGEKREAKELFERAFGTAEGRRPAGTQLAQSAMDEGDLAGAERIMRSVLLREPGAPEIHNLLGLVLEKQARFPEAVKAYAESARLDANFAEPRNNLGNLARRDRHDDEAERWYLDAIAADPYFMGAYNNLALLCQARGQIDRAIDLYGRALAKAPANAVVMNNLASLYFATGDNRSARALWRQAIEADPKYVSPLNNLAGMALGEEDEATAEGLLDRALALDPNYGDAHINKALVARRRGDNESARRELHEAAKDERAAGTAHMHLALIDLDERQPDQAIAELEAAQKLLGDRTDILNALGESYARLHERPKALVVLKRSLELDPKQEQVRAAVAAMEKQ